MSKVIEVIFYETPGHGYLKVDGDDLRGLKISQSFSEFSFYDEENDIFYLEEDVDARIFCKRCELDGYTIKEDEEYLDVAEENEIIRKHDNAYYGDLGVFGVLEQNLEGLDEFFGDDDEEDEDDEDDEEESDDAGEAE